MNGWRTQIGPERESNAGVIGVVVAQKFPDPQAIRRHLEEGISRVHPDTVWVMRDSERENHAAKFAWQTFKAHGIQPFQAPLVAYWGQHKKRVEHRTFDVSHLDIEQDVLEFTEYVPPVGNDLRATMRDVELRATCERIIVFHDKSSGVTADWLDYRDNGLCQAKIMVVERGKAKRKHRTGRAPD